MIPVLVAYEDAIDSNFPLSILGVQIDQVPAVVAFHPNSETTVPYPSLYDLKKSTL